MPLNKSNKHLVHSWPRFPHRNRLSCPFSNFYRELFVSCSKSEWEAKSESQWKFESQKAAASIGSLRTFGDLKDAHQRVPGNLGSDALDVWNAGIDQLGMTLNLAVYMV